MRQRKIRGHRRRWKDIEYWRKANIDFDLKSYLSNESDRFYAKIRVHPWSALPMDNSATTEPRGKTKQKILNALFDIYDDWKNKLDQLGKPYYLKIWLYEQRFSSSEVVCAIGENIDFYKNTFFKPEENLKINPEFFGEMKSRINKLEWDYRLDEDHYDNSDIGEPDNFISKEEYEDHKRWFEKLLKKPHRTVKFKKTFWKATESYSFKRGNMWLSGQK